MAFAARKDESTPEQVALAILSQSNASKLFNINALDEKLKVGGADLTTPEGQIFDELLSYVNLCRDRKIANPDTDVRYLDRITQYKVDAEAIEGRIHDRIVERLSIEAGVGDSPESKALTDVQREQKHTSFLAEYVRGVVLGDVFSPIPKDEEESPYPTMVLSKDAQMVREVEDVATRMMQQLKTGAERSVISTWRR